jgi:hypothetical protein
LTFTQGEASTFLQRHSAALEKAMNHEYGETGKGMFLLQMRAVPVHGLPLLHLQVLRLLIREGAARPLSPGMLDN